MTTNRPRSVAMRIGRRGRRSTQTPTGSPSSANGRNSTVERIPTWKALALNTRIAVSGRARSVTCEPRRLTVWPNHRRMKSGCRQRLRGGSGGMAGIMTVRRSERSGYDARMASVFTDAEIAYLRERMRGTIGTVGPNGQPHLTPTTLHYNEDEDAIDVGGISFGSTKKWRDTSTNPRVTLLLEDV